MESNARGIHDAAVCIANQAVEVFARCLRDEEKNEAWHELYRIAKAGIEAYLIQRTRELVRLNPVMN
jgi:hypothetical protein